ncbi:MAG: hypothetical protein J6D23_04720 [Clostridia bacterium]|nr:hypothetical protein [Clostridia bacterium]
MKKILAVALSVLMLLPMLSSIAFAEFTLPEGTETVNVAKDATVSVTDPNGQNPSIDSKVNVDAIIDGDKSTGTHSPQGMIYAYELAFDEVYYFTDVVVACNGKGTLANGSTVTTDVYNIYKIMVTVYYGDEVTFQSESLDVKSLKEIKVPVNAKGDRIEVCKVKGAYDRNEYMWEIEAYAPNIELCSAQLENVAPEAVFSATDANTNYWHAMNYKYLVDGDIKTGTHSPKGRNYSIWMHFNQEYLFSQIDIECNTDGGAKLAAGNEINDRAYNVSMMQIRVYNYNEDLVWDSDMVDVSTVTTLSVSPYVEGAIIEMKIYNGGFSGGEYLYEVAAYAQSGDHVFESGKEVNPTCLLPGYREYVCQCGKVIKKSLDPTGFHKWNRQEVTKNPTNVNNGVLTVYCDGCVDTKLYDVPATGHNWDNGTVIAPKCGEDGYTLYKCTDAECDLEYKANYVEAPAHVWDDGKLTKKPTVEEEGVITYTCSVCNGEKYGRVRKHKYTDNITDFSISEHVQSITDVQTTPFENPAVAPGNLFDGDFNTWWYGDKDSYVYVKLNQEYVFTSGFFYGTANWAPVTIEFYVENPSFDSSKPESEENAKYILTSSFGTGNINNGTDTSKPVECDLLDALSGGTRASIIKVITPNPKKVWNDNYPGSGCKLQELKLKLHKCEVGQEDYILEGPDYKPAKCGVDGSCLAKCQVCGSYSKVTIKASADVGHNYGSNEIAVDVEPTCVNTGVGHATCVDCKKVVNGITIPATGKHTYTEESIYVSAKCGFAGVKHMICKDCGKIGSSQELAPTGKHTYEWATKSLAAYTAIGKTEYCCIYCDQLDPDTKENVKVAEKIEIPDSILTYNGASSSSNEDENTLSFTYKLDLDEVKVIEGTCDVRVYTTIKDSQGREATIESYGKYATNSYNAETGEFTVTIYPRTANDVFEVNTVVRIMNFRGIVYKYYSAGSVSMNTAK